MSVADEWLDVVDEADCVIGRERRGQIHQAGLLHRAVHILLCNRAGNVFLQRRSMEKDTFPGCWSASASGHVDSGESYDAAMRRELAEELGWQAEDPAHWPRPVLRLSAQPLTGQEFVWVYLGETEGPFHLDPVEILEGRWVTPAALDASILDKPKAFADSFRLIWRQFRDTRHRPASTA